MINVKKLNAISPVYDDILTADNYNVADDIQNPDVILVRSANMHEMPINDNLLCVGRAGAGVNNIPLDAMSKAGVCVFNSPGANANAVKEMVCAALLMSSRKITDGISWVKGLEDTPDFEKVIEKGKSKFAGPELAGKTLGVIGLGAIGVLVANMGHALGMNVLGYDPYISVDHAWKLSRSIKHATDVNEIYEKSDYITLHLPLIDSTRNTVNAEVLGRMKPGAALINYARGGLVETDAVIEALKSGKLRTYCTDFPSAKLMSAPNVILTPHLGASTPESEDNCVRMVTRQIDDFIRTGSIVNSVNYPACPLTASPLPRISVIHKNIPNVIGSVTRVISADNLNIENMVNKARGEISYMVLDITGEIPADLIDRLNALDPVYLARLIPASL